MTDSTGLIDLQLATSSWDTNEHRAISRVIASDNYTMGQEVATFEEAFADYHGSKHAVMVNSGSSANLLMVAALKYHTGIALGESPEVVVPAVSWSTSYYPFQQLGFSIKFVDVDADTLNYDLDALEDALTDRTKVILAVNLLGNPNNFTRLQELAGRHEALIVEDNCESLGARFGERLAGSFGLASSSSFFFSHHISTMEGGMVLTDDEELYHVMLSLRAHGWTRQLPYENRVTGMKSADDFLESFRFVLPGYNLRPLEMSGAIGIEQLKKLPGLISGRRENALAFMRSFEPIEWIRTQKELGESSWFGFSMVIKEGANITRGMLVEKLKEWGVQCRPIVAGNFAKNEVVSKYFDYSIHGNLKNSDIVDTNGLFIGNHHFDVSHKIEELAYRLRSLGS